MAQSEDAAYQQIATTGGGLPVVERADGAHSLPEHYDFTVLSVAQRGEGLPRAVDAPVEREAKKLRRWMAEHMDGVAASLVSHRLVSPQHATLLVTQAAAEKRSLVKQAQGAGQGQPSSFAATYSDVVTSHQISLEDLFTTLDFVPLPRGIRFELLEQALLEENHIIGACVSRIARGATKRGWEYALPPGPSSPNRRGPDDTEAMARTDAPPADDPAALAEAAAGEAEEAALDAWVRNCNSTCVDPFRHLTEHTVAAYTVTSNAYVEVLRERFGDPAAKPSGLETVIPSTMRVIRGHRGFIQWLAGQFRWFNTYTPAPADRVAGAALWTAYWAERGVEVADPGFLASPWCRTITSQMPPGVWNPHLSDIIHFKDLSLSSKYYGFPRDYRISKLNALLQASLDYNIAFQRNNRIPPYVLVFHGSLSPEAEEDIKNYFRSIKGPENWADVPLLTAPPVPGGAPQILPAGASPTGRGALEIVKVAGDEKEGIFLELWARVIKDLAMHYGIGLDLLTTENSNRATIEVAEQMFNEDVISALHDMLETAWFRLTHDDLGLVRRVVKYTDLDTSDFLSKAQEAQIWRQTGTLNSNEIRARFLNEGPRPGGEQYTDTGMLTVEDEPGEETSTSSARSAMRDPAAAATAAAKESAGQSENQAPAQPASKRGVPGGSPGA